MSFLSIILIFVFLQIISLFMVWSPSKGRDWSFIPQILSYLFFLVILLTGKQELMLGPSFYLSPDKIRLLSFLSVLGAFLSFFFRTALSRQEREYSLLPAFIFLGGVFFLGAGDFVTFFLGLEMMSLLGPALMGLTSHGSGVEFGVRQFLLGGLSCVFFVLAVAFFYAGTEGLNFQYFLVKNHQFFSLSVVLILIVTGLKLGTFPFRSWLKGAYCHSSIPSLCTFLLLVHLVQAFNLVILLQNLIAECTPTVQEDLISVTLLLAFFSALFGHLSLWSQTRMRNILFHLHGTHAALLLMNLTFVFHRDFARDLMFYLVFHSLSLLGTFLVLHSLGVEDDDENGASELARLRERFQGPWGPFLGGTLVISLLGLTGFPLTAGFYSRFILFTQFLKGGHLPINFFLLFISTINIGYCLKLFFSLFTGEKSGKASTALPLPLSTRLILGMVNLLILSGGIFPTFYLNFF